MSASEARTMLLALLFLLPLSASAGLAFERTAVGLDGDDLLDVEEVFVDPDNRTSDEESAAVPGVVRKCCPPGLNMFRVNSAGCDDQVTCRIPDAVQSSLWSLGPGGGQYGFPTACPRSDNCTLVLLDGGEGEALGGQAVREGRPEPFCVDKLVLTDDNGQLLSDGPDALVPLAGVACARTLVDDGRLSRLRAGPATPGRVVPLRKCCAVAQRYDLASRQCVDLGRPTSTSTPTPVDYHRVAVQALQAKVFRKNSSALVDMSVGFPACGDDTASLDVAVFDLPWDEHLVDDAGNAVLQPEALRDRAAHGGQVSWTLRPDEFCVDDASHPVVEEDDDLDVDGDDLDGAVVGGFDVPVGTLVVKACRPQPEEVCRRFGCFRKCCPHDKYFAPVGNTHACVARPAEAAPLLPQVHAPPSNLSAEDKYVPLSKQGLLEEAYQRSIAHQRPHQLIFSSVINNICPDFRYRLDEAEDVWFFDRLGTLYQPVYADVLPSEYCVEDSQELRNLSVFLCLADSDPTQVQENARILLITVGLLISCIFLAATLATYCSLPALQNLHGKTLMCHVSSLLVAYLFLALTQLLTKPVFLQNEWICSIIGNCVLFTFLSAFSWLNVMCYDIWRTFGALRSSRSVKRSSASRRFRWYCVYAWGLSSLITAICVTVDQWPGNDKSVFRPQIGDGSCWFRTELDDGQGQAYGILIFFVGPLLVQTCCNLVLFVLTVMNYSRIKSEINRLHNPPNSRKVKKFQADSNKLKMNLKLFVVMGVTWVLELVSTFFPREHAVFYLSDTANALQGVMIFAIFVLKRKVMRALAVRLGRAPPPAPSSANPSMHADCRLGLAPSLAARGKTTSNSTLFTSAMSS